MNSNFSRPNTDAGSRLDVTAAPYFADPSGTQDSTEAILAAMDSLMRRVLDAQRKTEKEISELPSDDIRDPRGVENRKQDGKDYVIFPAVIPYVPTLYFPEGVYRISDTLEHRIEGLVNTPGGSDLTCQLRLCGDGPDRSILKLDDGSPGFSGETGKPLLNFLRKKSSNVAMSNCVEHLTLDTGKNNPSAVGLDYYANNSGAVRNVRIRSGDGSGAAGLHISKHNPSGMLLIDIEVDGFDYGLHLNTGRGTMFVAGERLTLRNQRRAGVYAGSLSMSLRKVQTSNVPCGVEFGSPHGHLVLVDSHLSGKGENAFKLGSGVAYVSNVTTEGFTRWADHPEGHKPQPGEWTLANGKCTPVDSGHTPPRLQVEDPPASGGRSESSVTVDQYGTVGDGITDDSPAIQRALDAGAKEIHFGPGRYLLDAPLTIPACVERICFHYCDLVTGPRLAAMPLQGVFVVGGETDQPLLFEQLFAWEQFRGECVVIDHASTRPLVVRDIHTQTLSLYRNSVEGGKVFMENVACTTGVIPGTRDHGRVCMRFKGQQVWARQLNPERGHPMVVNDGGTLWVLGFKTEDDATGFLTVNGGRTELLGGVLNFGGDQEPAFETRESWLRVSATTNSWGGPVFHTLVKESGNREKKVTADELPSRNFDNIRAHLVGLPFYGSTL